MRLWPVLLLILFNCHTWFGPDIWYHLTWGRHVVDNGDFTSKPAVLIEQPVIGNPYWFFQTVVYGLYELGGAYVVGLFFALLWVAILLLWQRAFRSGFAAAVFSLLFVICAQLRLEYRPEVFSYLFLAIMIWVFLRGILNRWLILGLMVLQVLWTNSHGYFFFGPVVAGAFLASRLMALRSLSLRELKWPALAFAGVCAATFVTPSGVLAWKLVFAYAGLARELSNFIEELQPLTHYAWWIWPLPVYWILWLIVAVFAGVFLYRRREIFSVLLAVVGLIVGVIAFRNVPLFLLLSGPLLGKVVETMWVENGMGWVLGAGMARVRDVLRASAGKPMALRMAKAVFILISVVLGVSVVTGRYHKFTLSDTTFGLGLEWAEYPIGAVEFLKSISFSGPVFNETGDGGYIQFHLREAEVFCDSYFVDTVTTLGLLQSRNDPSMFEGLDTRFKFNAVILGVENRTLVQYLLNQSAWVVGYADSHRIVFLRKALYPGATSRLVEGTYYRGEDLRRYSYSEPPVIWTDIARQLGDRGLLLKLIEDFHSAREVPSEFVVNILAFAFSVDTQDPQIAQLAIPFSDRFFLSRPGDDRLISELISRIR